MPNQQHKVPIPANANADFPTSKFNLCLNLKKIPANPKLSQFQPMESSDFVLILRALKNIFLEKWADYEPNKMAREGEGTGSDELAQAFRHFTEIDQKSESLKDTLEELTQRLARFNDFSPLALALLAIGVDLEDCRFGRMGGTRADEKRLELAKSTIERHWTVLKEGKIVSQKELQVSTLLADLLAAIMAEMAKQAKARRIFLPSLISPSPGLCLRQAFASHLADSEQFADQIGPLLDLLQCPFWEHPGLSPFNASISRLFENSLDQQLSEFILSDISQATNLDGICDLIQRIRFFLAQPGVRNVQRILENLWLAYSPKMLVQALDEPLSQACQSALSRSTAALDSRDEEKMAEFTKSSMALFKALVDFSEMARQVGVGSHSALLGFECWFERIAVYWTDTWRSVYLAFICKSIETADAQAGNGRPESPPSDGFSPLHRRSSLPDLLCPSSPSPLRASRPFFLADLGRQDLQLHEATVNCLAFCKAICDEFLGLGARHPAILLLCTLQISSVLADCLSTFCAMLLEQVEARPASFSKMVRAANGIEHFGAFLLQNCERFLGVKRLAELGQMDAAERARVLASCRHILGTARARSRAVADRIVEGICRRRGAGLGHFSALVTRNWEGLNTRRRPLHRLHQLLSPPEACAEQLLLFLHKLTAHFHGLLLPRLYSTARLALWRQVSSVLEQQLLGGQVPEYYERVEVGGGGAVGRLAWPKGRLPRLCLRLGFLPTTGQQVLLQIHVLYATDVPVLDSASRSSDPYLRIELLPRFLFPLDLFPAQNTETRKQTLSPKWNQTFQIALPEECFFLNGACLCLTLLDQDVLGYNDMAGQALLRLASIPRLNGLSTRKMPPPVNIPLRMPSPGECALEPFQVLLQRSGRDGLARQMTDYEKYVHHFHLLPTCARDEKEWRAKVRRGWRDARQRLRGMLAGKGGS